MFKTSKSLVIKSRLEIAKQWSGLGWGMTVHEHGVSFWCDEINVHNFIVVMTTNSIWECP